MLRPDRLTAAVRARGKSLVTAGSKHAGAVRGHRKSLVLAGAAVALVGAGAATVASGAAAGEPTPRPLAALNPPAGPTMAAPGTAARQPALTHAPARPQAASQPAAPTWARVRAAISRQARRGAARHGTLTAADQLMPVRTSGQQQWMPIDSSQAANATTIVRQALHQRMGVRSAVIAVATAMQESMLQNINYGTGTALGLFQQQPDSGWGSAGAGHEPGVRGSCVPERAAAASGQRPLVGEAAAMGQRSGRPELGLPARVCQVGVASRIAGQAHRNERGPREPDRRESALITHVTTVSGPGLPLLPPATADRTASPPGSPTRQAGVCAPPSPRGRGTIHRTVILPR